jgi:hypothetical protein
MAAISRMSTAARASKRDKFWLMASRKCCICGVRCL